MVRNPSSTQLDFIAEDDDVDIRQPESLPLLNSTSRTSESEVDESSHATQRRSSIFLEVGLGGDDAIIDQKIRQSPTTTLKDILENLDSDTQSTATTAAKSRSNSQNFLQSRLSLASQMVFAGLLVALLWPGLISSFFATDTNPIGAEASSLKSLRARSASNQIVPRANSPTDVCTRWAHMSAVVNGTLYIYGGQASTSAGQTDNTWNNNFLSLDLTKTWNIGSPSLTGLPQPSGPPAVSLGYLWNSMDSLYLYGGESSWKPVVSPSPNSIWSYSIASSSWTEHAQPKDQSGQTVQRAAEGAGVSMPGLGRGLYLGGHLDGYTTQGWSQSIARVYLQSTLEFTMPGHTNPQLSSSAAVGSDGAFRNISTNSAGFPQRADGVMVYVPNYGDSGIVIALGGGTNQTFTQMNVIDVYDVATSNWYKQSTSGPTPEIRVNPCAVALSSADGSSAEVYMYGGQNLIPAGNQTQYDDMWILTVPSFTWIQVDQSGQSTPPGRAGHTCNVWNGQMVVVGGYVGTELSCDSPGIYVFNTSALAWQNEYVSLGGKDPLNRQVSQQNDSNALQGSYEYTVPVAVQAEIGGNAQGSATVTQPVVIPTQGPLVSERPKTYTVTGTNGASPTQSGGLQSGGGSGSGSGSGSGGSTNHGSSNTGGIIAAGVIAGILALLAAYLALCVWLYRKQLKVYKNHVALAQQEHLSGAGVSPLGMVYTGKYSDKDRSSDQNYRNSGDNRSGYSGGQTPGSSHGNSSGTGPRRNELGTNNPYRQVPGGQGLATAQSSTDDLMRDHEPSFLGVVLNPRRSLRVVNRD